MGKQEIIVFAAEKFTQFGSKRFTMEELAELLGISKKTIYKYFFSKEDLVSESVKFLLDKIRAEIDAALDKETDPILKIVAIYQIGFEHFKCFRPAFIFGLNKYYPKASSVFETFRQDIVFNIVYKLLEEAKQNKIIRQDVNLTLVCEFYFLRIDNFIYKPNNFFEVYSNKELLNHLIVYNLKGLLSTNSIHNYFE
ncbi:TetR/AcrR family transcriptional regulator [Flavobacteriaceae bacterium XHP0103]|nr:TetR/AcrR family transcriptional regulator [Marixanthotalea marina]